jgi:transcriptional regulator with XRE-family HTH domain
MPQLFGDKLRYLRHRQGMTQVSLAKEIELASYTHVTKLEAGQRTPSLDLVVRIADVFGTTTDYLLRDQVLVEEVQQSDRQLSRNYVGLSHLFGAKLRELRYQRGWGQTELARQLGLARRGYISNLEAGRKLPSIELVLVIADLFGVTTDDLLRPSHSIELV